MADFWGARGGGRVTVSLMKRSSAFLSVAAPYPRTCHGWSVTQTVPVRQTGCRLITECCCCSLVSGSLRPHGPQHAGPPCPSPFPGACSDSCPSSRWCHLTLSSSVIPCLSLLQSCPASGSFPVSQLFPSGGQRIGVSASASVLMNTQDWSPLGWTGWISLQSRGLSRVFSNTTVQKHQFFGAQLSL